MVNSRRSDLNLNLKLCSNVSGRVLQILSPIGSVSLKNSSILYREGQRMGGTKGGRERN